MSTPEEIERQEQERLEGIAREHRISVSEVGYCERNGYDPERYALLKTVRTPDDFRQMQETLRERAQARAEARKQIETEAERRKLGAA